VKEKFLNSVPSHPIRWDVTWVYQGYMGPYPNGRSGDSTKLSPNCGLQEVMYWWGPSKLLHCIPLLGSVAFSTVKVLSNIDGTSTWCHLYFDSKTGKCLSHYLEVAASKLNDIGNQLFDSGKYEEAKEYFFNAYTHSTNKTKQETYKANENKAQAKIDATKQGGCSADHSKDQKPNAKSLSSRIFSAIPKNFKLIQSKTSTSTIEFNMDK
jgi:hypothetical protein